MLRTFFAVASILAILLGQAPAVSQAAPLPDRSLVAALPEDALAVTLEGILDQAAPDWDVAGGHVFTQTSGSPALGFTVSDEGGVLFWAAFQQLGGVNAVGYPISKRFEHGGFVTQAMQKAVFQWRPDTKSVAFVNVFDDLSAAGKDNFLNSARATPKPAPFPAEAGKSFDEVVRIRQSALEARPAIKVAYFAASDPMLLYGLPTSQITDMGNHFAIRLQRAVIQEWKQDVPWAQAGQTTVANGGDIAKEAGLWPAPALVPGEVSARGVVPPPAPANPAPPPAPAVPGAQVTPGIWSGPMDPAPGAFAFEVSGDGTKLTNLALFFRLPPSAGCGPNTVSSSVRFRQGFRAIENGGFDFWVQDDKGRVDMGLTGRFTSSTTLTGTYEFYAFKLEKADGTQCATLTGKGTWTAKPRT